MSQLSLFGSQPWQRTDRPRWWRRNQLQVAADAVMAGLVIYRRGEYWPSLLRAAAARDDFYRRHEPGLFSV